MSTPHSMLSFSAALLCLSLCLTAQAEAQTLYGSDVSLDQTGTIDPANGAWTSIGSQGIPSGESINGIAHDEVHGILFGINTSTDDLVTLNQITGLATILGTTSGGQFNGLAYDPAADALYSVTTGDVLYSIDPSNGASTFIGGSVIPDQIEGLGYDPASGNLYGLNGLGQIYVIDTSTGSSAPLPNGIGVGGLWRGLTWDATNQRLLASIVGGAGGQLYDVNPATGLGTLIGATTNFAQGLGMTGSTPPPPFTYTVPVLTAGQSATLSYTDAGSFSSVYLLYSRTGAGPTNTIFGPLDMTAPIKKISIVASDVAGDGTHTIFVPPAASGFTLYTQAVSFPVGFAALVSNSFAALVQ